MAYSYQRRQELAREKGFSSYGEYRRATEFANRDKEFRRIVGEAGGSKGRNLAEAKLFYQAFREGNPDDYRLRRNKAGDLVVRMRGGKPQGAKAKWIIDVAHYVDQDEWRQLYPKGKQKG